MKHISLALCTFALGLTSHLYATFLPDAEGSHQPDKNIKSLSTSGDWLSDDDPVVIIPKRDSTKKHPMKSLSFNSENIKSSHSPLSARLVLTMPANHTPREINIDKKIQQFVESDHEEDDFSELDISEALERLALKTTQENPATEDLTSQEQHVFKTPHQQPIAPQRHLLEKMIDTAKNSSSPAEERILHGRQALMCLISKSTLLSTFTGNVDDSIRVLVYLLSDLNDPYGTLRLAEYLHKNPILFQNATEKENTCVTNLTTEASFRRALTLAFESYDPEVENVYFFNTLRTIVSEAVLQTKTRDHFFYCILTSFIDEVSVDTQKTEFINELRKSKDFVEKQFGLAFNQ
ncbi:MAG: hypothetical protein ACTHJ4_05460 [Candidatus Nucleicultricaceae bacterium]